MRLTYFVLMVWMLTSCVNNIKTIADASYWEKLKDSFATQNVESFAVDCPLQKSYRSFHQIKNHTIDSAIGYGVTYLYSWQKCDSGFTAFTTFVDAGEHGSRIIYLIFGSKDSLVSATQVASKGGEGGILYETRSKFSSQDTLYKTSAATTMWDLSKPEPWSHRLNNTKGDSAFSYLIVLKNGQVVEKLYDEKKELNLNE